MLMLFSMYSYLCCFFSFFLPLSFFFMNQEHLSLFNFFTIYQLMETFNLMMVGLSGWVASMMILFSYFYVNKDKWTNLFPLVIFSLTIIIVCFFTTNNFILFYVFFEVSIFPTMMLIMKWGYQPERLQASFYLIMYTVVGSLPLLLFLLGLMFMTQSFFYNFYGCGIIHLSMISFLSLGSMMAFLIKAPLWGVHLWLPKAHVEAPVSGSMVLAGLLLKLGGYGLFKIYMCHFYGGSLILIMLSLSLWSTVVVSLVCLRQTDIKILIAYSSVIHMGLMIIGLFSGSTIGITGALMMMISHGLSSPALFASANFNYENTYSRNLVFQKGFHSLQPFISLVWFFLVTCNMAAPPFLSLASEITIITSSMKLGFFSSFLLGLSSFLALSYNLLLFSTMQGKINSNIAHFHSMRSISAFSFWMLCFPCLLLIFSCGLY